MSQLHQLKRQLKQGRVYRRTELANWSKSVDRHLDELVQDGTLQKLSQGLYYFPKESAFGKTPPDENVLVQSFLNDHRFLLTTPNAYNSLGVGTTQLYNERTVYNHKRHGEFKLGNRTFHFKVKNLDTLAEDSNTVLKKVAEKVAEMDAEMDGKKLAHSVAEYGSVRTKKMFAPLLQPHTL